MDRPGRDEYARFYETYVKRVPEPLLMDVLRDSVLQLRSDLASIPDDSAGYRYLLDKWTVWDVLRHCADTERVFGFRALWIARGDERPIPGFDERLYAHTAAKFPGDLSAVKEELELLRRTNLLLFASLAPDDLLRKGVANGSGVTVRALGYMLVGHWRHHMAVLQDRYGINSATGG
jgi:hypothetical protein